MSALASPARRTQRYTALVLRGAAWALLLLRRFVFETSPKPQGEQLGRIAPQIPKYARLRQGADYRAVIVEGE
jgi:hypothetical protein